MAIRKEGYGSLKPYQDNKEDLSKMAGSENLTATAGTKIGGTPKRGPGLKLMSDFKGVAKGETKKAGKQAGRKV